ncbi:hypothetical protein THASP1DRAFT_27842 [Thamnocephalis sphaerospora]|uniref:Pentacotripeptide-repeat region of PRORP domain-containing protein n=1 Tax=Thamnocephalis sphaerospora TaxID=78915 RepID=A0A4P9XVQ4_9FUNG|nr:hypothetical protein THASP1DRAFT_27842 [Thamnocephalis sphaerospora]|eukprot:RKP10358.1 hypothetical protein THASP1DRAFT_27842 [Thamnocephalis sphaerospora]
MRRPHAAVAHEGLLRPNGGQQRAQHTSATVPQPNVEPVRVVPSPELTARIERLLGEVRSTNPAPRQPSAPLGVRYSSHTAAERDDLARRESFYNAQLEKMTLDSHFAQALYRINASRAPNGYERGLRILERMRERRVTFKRSTHYNHLLWFFRKYQMLPELWKTFCDMRASGMPVTVVTYNNLISAFGARDLELAGMLVSEMADVGLLPNTTTYNIILNLLSQRNQLSDMLELYENMMQHADAHAVAPNEYTFSTLMHAAAQMGRLDLAKRFHEEMRSRNVPENVVSYTVILNADNSALVPRLSDDCTPKAVHTRHRVARRDQALVSEMKNRAIMPNNFTYTSLIARAFRTGDRKRALQHYTEMLSAGIKPDTVTYGALIHALGRERRFDEVDRICERMRRERVEESIELFTIIAQSLILRSEFRAASKTLEPFLRIGQLDAVAAVTLLLSYTRAGRLKEALQAWRQMLVVQGAQLATQAYFPLMTAFARRGEVRVVRWLFASVTRLQPTALPTPELLTGLVHAFAQRGKPDAALAIWRQCQQLRISCSHRMVTFLFHAHGRHGDLTLLRATRNEVAQAGIVLNVRQTTALAVALARCGDPKESSRLLKELHGMDVHTRPWVLNICREFGVVLDRGHHRVPARKKKPRKQVVD